MRWPSVVRRSITVTNEIDYFVDIEECKFKAGVDGHLRIREAGRQAVWIDNI
jgi:hypothetical protein